MGREAETADCADSSSPAVICLYGVRGWAEVVVLGLETRVVVVVAGATVGWTRWTSSVPIHICGVPRALQLEHGRPPSHDLPSFYNA